MIPPPRARAGLFSSWLKPIDKFLPCFSKFGFRDHLNKCKILSLIESVVRDSLLTFLLEGCTI